MAETKPIRVAQIIGMAIDGGVEACIMNYYRNIDKTKVQFDFFVETTSNIINKHDIETMGGKVFIIPSYKNIFKYMKTLRKIFKMNHYDIVHSNMNSLSLFPLKAAKMAGVKIRIAHSHSTSNAKEKFRNFLKNILRKFSKKYATHYFACGEKAGRWLFGNKVYDEGKVSIINNGICIDKFKFNIDTRYSIRKKYGLNDDFVVGNIGRMVTQKNQEFLIDVFFEIQKQKENSRLIIVGDGPLLKKLTEKSKKLNINNKIVFCGAQKQIQDYYNCMDCFVLPSIYEGVPVVSIEAQINGIDCFFSENITKEVLINDNVDYISLDNSPKEWADLILKKSIYNIEKREESYKTFIGSNYDIQTEANKLVELYFKFIKEEHENCNN